MCYQQIKSIKIHKCFTRYQKMNDVYGIASHATLFTALAIKSRQKEGKIYINNCTSSGRQ